MKMSLIMLILFFGNTCLALSMEKRSRELKKTKNFVVPINRHAELLKVITYSAGTLTLLGMGAYYLYLTVTTDKENFNAVQSYLFLPQVISAIVLLRHAFEDAARAFEAFRKIFLGYNPSTLRHLSQNKLETQELYL